MKSGTPHFSVHLPETSKLFVELVRKPQYEKLWEKFLDRLNNAQIIGKCDIDYVGDLEILLKVGNRSQSLRLTRRKFDQYPIQEVVIEYLNTFSNGVFAGLMNGIKKELWETGSSEYKPLTVFTTPQAIAPVIYELSRSNNRTNFDRIVRKVRDAFIQSDERVLIKRRECSWDTAKEHLESAILNGLEPEVVIEFMNQIICSKILNS